MIPGVPFWHPCSATPGLVREVCLSGSTDLSTGFPRLLRWSNLTKNPSILTDGGRRLALAKKPMDLEVSRCALLTHGIHVSAGPSLSTTQNHDFLWFSSNIFEMGLKSPIRVRLKRFQYERTPYSNGNDSVKSGVTHCNTRLRAVNVPPLPPRGTQGPKPSSS